MRKSYALFILIVVFFPLAFAAMTLTSIRPWILDRDFYNRVVGDDRLYEALLTEELPNQLNREVFIAAEQLPVDALSVALREVVTSAYLRAQAVNVVDKVFDYIDGRDRAIEISWNIAPIKAALLGEAGTRFAATLAAALPTCSVGQEPIAPGGSLTRCISTGASVDAAAGQIVDALPGVLENTPDQIILNDRVSLRMNWYNFDWLLGSSVRTGLDVAMICMIAFAAIFGLVGAYLGGDDLRARLKWLSSSLFAPASLFLLAGLVLSFPVIARPLSDGLTYVRWGVQYSEAFREAVLSVIVPVIQQVGNGFLLTGVVSCLIALGLLIWSWATPSNVGRSAKMVQVPAQNS